MNCLLLNKVAFNEAFLGRSIYNYLAKLIIILLLKTNYDVLFKF
jgi:hypothetical protein